MTTAASPRHPPPSAWVLAVAAAVGLVSCARTTDPGDLTAEARLILAAAEQASTPLTLHEIMGPAPDGFAVPPLIRVWRRGVDGSTSSCEGRVDLLDLEDYVAGVVPSEWMAEWAEAALDAGAIAARTYGAFWVAAGGRYACADVDDTTWSQVYREVRHPRTDAAVERTAGAVATREGSLIFAEYSAENGHPTATGVHDEVCRGQRVRGHGRGMCQWGTQRWATQGRQADWMVAHYYPGATVSWADEALIDGIPIEVTGGDRFALSLQVANPGPDPWPPGSFSVHTDSAAFEDETWPEPSQPLRFDEPIAPGTVATLQWWMRAPEVELPEEHAQFFWLEGPLQNGVGSSGSWHIRVHPAAAGPDEANAPARRRWPLFGLLLGALGLGAAGFGRWARR